MIALRFLAVVSFSAFLTGCGTFCPSPGEPGFVNEKPCSYFMKVKEINKARSEVTATISTRVKERDDINYTTEYVFPVRDLERLTSTGQVIKGKEYLFFNALNGPSLEVFPKGSDPLPETEKGSDPITK